MYLTNNYIWLFIYITILTLQPEFCGISPKGLPLGLIVFRWVGPSRQKHEQFLVFVLHN